MDKHTTIALAAAGLVGTWIIAMASAWSLVQLVILWQTHCKRVSSTWVCRKCRGEFNDPDQCKPESRLPAYPPESLREIDR